MASMWEVILGRIECFFYVSGVTRLFYYHCNGNLSDTIRPVYKSNICFTRESCTKAPFFQLFFFFWSWTNHRVLAPTPRFLPLHLHHIIKSTVHFPPWVKKPIYSPTVKKKTPYRREPQCVISWCFPETGVAGMRSPSHFRLSGF